VQEQDSMQLFVDALKQRTPQINLFLKNHPYQQKLSPKHIKKAVLAYLQRPAKRLRPTLTMLATALFGGAEKDVLPIAVAIELFHTWTLVHDDIIDDDSLRRGEPTVHTLAQTWAKQEYDYTCIPAQNYGRDIAILAGDVQQGWVVDMFLDAATNSKINTQVVIKLLRMLESTVMTQLIKGETLDFQFATIPIQNIKQKQIIEMMTLKTGSLLKFAAIAGAAVAVGKMPEKNDDISKLGEFAENCGIAFQLQDDILGIVGNEKILGKPIGSDIVEGKRTIIILEAWNKANSEQKKIIQNSYGNKNATEKQILQIKNLLVELNGIEATKKLAEKYLHHALKALEKLPSSKYKNIFRGWAEFMTNRIY